MGPFWALFLYMYIPFDFKNQVMFLYFDLKLKYGRIRSVKSQDAALRM